MTVSVQTPTSSQAANGVTTAFPFAYKVRSAADLVVTLADAIGNETAQTLGVHYTVSGAGTSSGTVTFLAAPANGLTVRTRRVTALSRSTDYQGNGDLLAATLNNDVDALWLALQEVASGAQSAANTVHAPPGESLTQLLPAAQRLDKLLVFNPITGQPVLTTFTQTQVASALAAIFAGSAGPLDALTFLQAGAGAVSRTAQTKARDIISVSDFSSGTTASTGAAGGTVVVPAGVTPTLPASYPNVVFDYLNGSTINMFGNGVVDPTITAKRTLRSYHAGAHGGNQKATFAIEAHPVGSGTNGPLSADYGLMIGMQKESFPTTTTVGEIDCITIGLRQGGTTSDGSGILFNIQHCGTGFICLYEGLTTLNPGGSGITQGVHVACGVVDNVTPGYYGIQCEKTAGNAGTAFLGDHNSGAQWDKFMSFLKDGVEVWKVDQNGWLTLKDIFVGATPTKTLRVSGGNFSILNDAGGAEILTVSDAGLLTAGNVNASTYQSGGTQVVGSRVTGWGAATGGSKVAFTAGTATLAQTAAAVAQLITDLRTHGLIGT